MIIKLHPHDFVLLMQNENFLNSFLLHDKEDDIGHMVGYSDEVPVYIDKNIERSEEAKKLFNWENSVYSED